MHPFEMLMIATFMAVVATLITGVAGMGKTDTQGRGRSTRLMMLRVGLSVTLVLEILVYATFIKS